MAEPLATRVLRNRLNHTCNGLLGRPTAIVAIPPKPVAPTVTQRQHTLLQSTLLQSPALPPATPIAAPATPVTPPSPQPQQPQQLQQLRIYIPPEPAVPSVEQGPRQGPRYSKEIATIVKIYTDNKLVTACQGVPVCHITVSNLLEDPA